MRFEVAMALGMTVDQLGKRMSSYEFTEWVAFLELRAKRIEDAQKDAM